MYCSLLINLEEKVIRIGCIAPTEEMVGRVTNHRREPNEVANIFELNEIFETALRIWLYHLYCPESDIDEIILKSIQMIYQDVTALRLEMN